MTVRYYVLQVLSELAGTVYLTLLLGFICHLTVSIQCIQQNLCLVLCANIFSKQKTPLLTIAPNRDTDLDSTIPTKIQNFEVQVKTEF
jgi:hypothetical protein